MTKRIIAALAVFFCGIGPVLAHHSEAEYDRDKLIVLKGEMLSFKYMNPHAWISVMAKVDGKGETTRWDVQATAPGSLTRIGISPDTVKAGDKLTVGIHPLRDGRHGGAMAFIVTADGKDHGADVKELGLKLEDLKP